MTHTVDSGTRAEYIAGGFLVAALLVAVMLALSSTGTDVPAPTPGSPTYSSGPVTAERSGDEAADSFPAVCDPHVLGGGV